MICELCGKSPATYTADIEGTSMKVCTDCSRFGTVKGKSEVRIVVEEKKRPEIKEPDYIFIQGYGSLVKNARERLGLKQEEMAKRLNERESVLHQIESEHLKPSVDLARKLERTLHIHIIDEVVDKDQERIPEVKSGPLTLGDFIKTRKK